MSTNFTKAISFVINTIKTPKVSYKEATYLSVKRRKHSVNVYLKNKKKDAKTIVLISGFSVTGFKDERMNNLAIAFAEIGYKALVVSFDDLENLRISTNLVQEMIEVFEYISHQEKSKLGLLAPSFTAGIVMCACANNRLQNKISSICAIGSYANIETSIKFVLENNDIDDYGRNILLKNFIKYTDLKHTSALSQILQTAIQDNGFKRKHPMLPGVLSEQPENILQIWEKINSDSTFRLSLLNQVQHTFPNYDAWVRQLNAIGHVDEISAPITLIHGENDDVIPATESQQIFEKRNAKNLQTHICITSILDHGDIQYKLKSLLEGYKMITAFSYFFKSV